MRGCFLRVFARRIAGVQEDAPTSVTLPESWTAEMCCCSPSPPRVPFGGTQIADCFHGTRMDADLTHRVAGRPVLRRPRLTHPRSVRRHWPLATESLSTSPAIPCGSSSVREVRRADSR
jgi:hypothetical protein